MQLIVDSEGVGVRWVQGRQGDNFTFGSEKKLRWSEEVTLQIRIVMGLKSGGRYFGCWTEAG